MLEYLPDGDLFESDADALVNAVNCYGVMGGGIALAFAQRFPNMLNEYVKVCDDGLLRPGLLHIWKDEDTKIVINLPTKDHYGYPSKMEYVVDGLNALRDWAEFHPDLSIALCKLGCGLGGLEWEEVHPQVVKFLEEAPNTIYVYGEKLS